MRSPGSFQRILPHGARKHPPYDPSSQTAQKLLDPLIQPVPVAVSLDRNLDEAVDQLGEGDSREVPQAGVHGDAGEARQGVDLVDVETVLPLDEEVDPGEPHAADG